MARALLLATPEIRCLLEGWSRPVTLRRVRLEGTVEA